MNAALCREVGGGAFPSPQQVLQAGPQQLQARCGVGYRAKTICALAQQVTAAVVAPAPSDCLGGCHGALMLTLLAPANSSLLLHMSCCVTMFTP